jgi:hypothetical protein
VFLVKVTRIVYSSHLNAGEYGQLVEQAGRLGRVRSLVWDQYGSIAGVGRSDRQIRDAWMTDGTAEGFGVLANAWKETVRDAVADIRAHREAAKVEVRRQWRRGHNHTCNQIIIRSDNVRTFTLCEGGDVWLAVPGLTPRTSVAVPLNTTQPPSGTLRLILRGGRAEVHYQIDDKALKSAHRPAGMAAVGVDKGYSAVLTDSDGEHHGPELGVLLRARSDLLKARNTRRAKPRSIANHAAKRGQHGKAARIRRNNLGTVKKRRQQRCWKQRVRMVTYRAVNAVVDKANVVVAEDLTRPFVSRAVGANTKRRLAAWTKGVTAEAFKCVSDRRGSAVRLVNAAYTSQVIPGTGLFGRRVGDRLYRTRCGVVWQADHAAAINILDRDADPDIGLWTPHWRVKQIIQERADRRRSRLPDQDSNTAGHCRCGERIIQSRSALITE